MAQLVSSVADFSGAYFLACLAKSGCPRRVVTAAHSTRKSLYSAIVCSISALPLKRTMSKLYFLHRAERKSWSASHLRLDMSGRGGSRGKAGGGGATRLERGGCVGEPRVHR
eukprot:2409718-Pyramimonas_sp.AAC.2